MKRMLCLLAISAMLCACLPAACAAGEGLKDVRCDVWHFSVRIPEEINVSPVSFEDWDTNAVIAGGLKLSGGAEDDLSWIQVIRRSRIYDTGGYLCHMESYLYDYGEIELGEFNVYRFGGRVLYGCTGIVYGEQGEELFREIRLIPVSDNRGTEFAARYSAETETTVLSLMDTVIRNYQPDEETEKAEATFLPESHRAAQDLRNGEFLFRAEDAEKIETDGYFTAVLYMPDWYSSEDVHAMKPGDTILIMDRVLTITGVEPWVDDDGSWYETDLYATDNTLTEEHFTFTLIPTEDGTAFWPYFYPDNHSASRVGTVRIRVPQLDPVKYVYEEEGGRSLISGDLLNSFEGDPALMFISWNEYTHSCRLEDGRLTRVETWAYPHSPEDVFAQ